MKLVLHYLKFDLRRWKWLVALQWALVPVYVWLTWLFSQVDYSHTKPGTTVADVIFISTWVAFGILSLTGSGLCILAGMDRSTVRGKSWDSGRPRRFTPSFCGRVLFLLLAAALPSILAHCGMLVAMRFSAAAVLRESGLIAVMCTGTFLCIALWAYIWPRLAYMIIGLLIGGFFWVIWESSQPRLNPYAVRVEFPPAEWLLASVWLCAVAALFLQRVQGRFYGALKGLSLGAGFACLCYGYTAIHNQWLRWTAPDLDDLLAGAEVRSASSRQTIRPFAATDVSGKPTTAEALYFTVSPSSDLASPEEESRGSVIAVSWQADSSSAWTPWLPTLHGTASAGGGDGQFVVPAGSLDAFRSGKLRIALQTAYPREEREVIPLKEGHSASGRDWSLSVVTRRSIGQDIHWAAWLRITSNARRPLDADLGLVDDTVFSRGVMRSFPALPFVRLAWMSEVAGVPDSSPLPDSLQLRHSRRTEMKYMILELGDVSIDRSEAEPDSNASMHGPEAYERWGGGRAWRVQTHLLRKAAPRVPDEMSDEYQIAEYLHWLVAQPDSSEPMHGPAQKLAVHVPRHMPLFLEALRAGGFNLTILEALAWGTPDDLRVELIGKLPDMHCLTYLADRRGWQAEARAQFSRLVQETGMIGYGHEMAALRFKEPAFSEALRQHFRFAPEFIRYWKSVPRLAADLPTLTKPFLDRLAEKGKPFDEAAFCLLQSGEAAALKALLSIRRDSDHMYQKSMPEANRTLCRADGRRASEDHAEFLRFIGNTTEADYRFDQIRQCWMQLATSP